MSLGSQKLALSNVGKCQVKSANERLCEMLRGTFVRAASTLLFMKRRYNFVFNFSLCFGFL